MKHVYYSTLVFGIAVLLLFTLSGCANFKGFGSKTGKGEPQVKEATAVYYDFEDVLIPKKMKLIDDKTVIVSSPGYTSGIMTFRGWVNKRSLLGFFSRNMAKDNWDILSMIKSPGSVILIYQKSSRCAVVTIKEKSIFTYVEVGVAPTLTQTGILPDTTLFD